MFFDHCAAAVRVCDHRRPAEAGQYPPLTSGSGDLEYNLSEILPYT
jgi:hypothetical protein